MNVDPIVKLKEVAMVLWLVRSDSHRIDIWPEDQVFLLLDVVNSFRCFKSLLEC